MKIEHLFSPNTQKVLETRKKLAFIHPIVVLKTGLKNNWTHKLEKCELNLRLLLKFTFYEFNYFRHFQVV